MGSNKGVHGYRPRRDPRFNRSSRSQRLRRLREKEALLKLQNEQQVIDKSSLPATKKGILNLSKQNLKKHLEKANNCISRPYPIRDTKGELFRHAKQKALLNLLSGQIINESLPSYSQQVTSKDSVLNKNKENLNSSEVDSNLLKHSSNTRVVNSVPVTIVEILGSSKESLKTFSTHVVCKNKGSCITKRCEQKSNPRSNKSKGQCLCSAKKKEALTKLCGTRNIKENFQDCVREVTSKDSVANSSNEILNTQKENKRYSDFSQNATGILDSLPVMKTEILDPPEDNNRVIYEDFSQSEPTMGCTPVIKVENLDLFQGDLKPLLPIIKVKEAQSSNIINESSIAYSTSIMTNNNNMGNSKDVLKACSKIYSYPFGNICLSPESYKSISSKKRKLDSSVTVSHNKVNTHKVHSISSKPVCGCFKKVAAMKQLCENNVKSVHQDDANQLCLCKTTNNTLPESINEEAMKEFYLQNPDFGKINHKT